MRIVTLALLGGLSAACGSSYGDAGAETAPLMPQVINVPSTPDGGTPPTCPPSIYGVVSQGSASCDNPPLTCVSGYDGGVVIECTCQRATATGPGSWECHERR